MRKVQRRYVRQMPKIYGNVEQPRRSFAGVGRFFKTLLWIALGAGVVYFLFFGPFFRIRTVEVEGATLTSGDQFAHLVPKGASLWTFPESEIIKQVMANPLILSVGVFRGIPSTVRLVLQERKPELAWHTGTTMVLLDADGYAFQSFGQDNLPAVTTPAGKAIAAIPHVYDTKSVPVTLDTQVASSIFVQFVTTAKEQLSTNLPTLIFDRIEITDTTYDVAFISKDGMRVLMNSAGDAGVQVRNLTRLVHQQKVAFNSQVDLRIDRWAYVR